MLQSPYKEKPIEQWEEITTQLVNDHPLKTDEIVDIVLSSWNGIFMSDIGAGKYKIGKDIFPKPQIMGFLLNELIALELSKRYPGKWRGDITANEKDLVYLPDNYYSIEIKTSSNDKHIYGNRSYAQKSSRSKKSKSGYYLAINFQKFESGAKKLPQITLVRFGWLDHEDWIGQNAATGQQARLNPEIEQKKLLVIYQGE